MPAGTTVPAKRNFRDYNDLNFCGKGETYREVKKTARSDVIWHRLDAVSGQIFETACDLRPEDARGGANLPRKDKPAGIMLI
jgi:hypothetical protein